MNGSVVVFNILTVASYAYWLSSYAYWLLLPLADTSADHCCNLLLVQLDLNSYGVTSCK